MSALYFNVFEGGGLELMLAQHDGATMKQIEFRFATLIQSMVRGDSPAVVQTHWQSLQTDLEQNRPILQESSGGFWNTLVQSFIILLREGLEAMLIIGALASFLRKSGRQDDVKKLYLGALCGVVLSLVAGAVLLQLLAHSGAYKLILEGVSMMLAAVMLFWVGNWLLARRHAMQWQAYVRDQLSAAGNSTWAMACVAMLAVFREGAETVLFIAAIASAPTASGNGVLAGVILAAATLALCFYLLRALALSIPLKLFFSISAALLLFLGFTFTGHGIAALQLAGWIGSHPQLNWPTLATLGLFPTIEGYTAQGLYLGLLLILLIKSQKLNPPYGKLGTQS